MIQFNVIIASLTTIPKRIITLPYVIDSILNQSHPVDQLHLNIPYRCERTGEDYDLTKIDTTDSRIKVFRTIDYGAITKVAPTFLRFSELDECFIFSVDDDFVYQSSTLEKLMEAFLGNSRIITRYGGSLSVSGEIQSWYGVGQCSFLEGFGGVLYPSNIIEDDFSDLLNFVAKDQDLIRSDDIVLSTYFNFHGREIYLYNPITSHDSYSMTGRLDTEHSDALRLDTYDDRLKIYQRSYFKTLSFLERFWTRE